MGRGTCKLGSACKFSHDDRDGEAREQITAPSSSNQSTPAPAVIVTDYGSWLRQQYEREASESVATLSGDQGFDVLAKIVEERNLAGHLIELLVKLLSREEFRFSLMREHTNKVYGLLVGSSFLMQLHGHIKSELRAAKPHDVRPYLLLIEELMYRSTDGWKELPLDAINSVIQKLEKGSAKADLVMRVNPLTAHRNKLRAQATLSPPETDDNRFLDVEFRNLPLVPDKEELLQPYLSSDLPVNLVGKKYSSTCNYLETHFRLLREDCIDPLRQGIKAYRNNQSSRELRIYQKVMLVGYRCGEEGLEYVLSFHDSGRTISEGSKGLVYGALLCLSSDGFRDSFIFGVVTGTNFQGKGATRFTVNIRVMGKPEAPIVHGRTYVMVESTTAYFEAYYHVLKSLRREDMENVPFTKYLRDLQQQVDPPSYLLRRENGDLFDFGPVFPSMKEDIGRSVIHVMQDWPQWPCTLDEAQLQALKHGLTKELSIIQGPPGTGKTFLGLLLVKLLLANFKPAAEYGSFGWVRSMPQTKHSTETYGRKGPILVICMTNHALDQFLEGIYKFEKNLIRIGARSQSKVLQERTLKKVLEEERSKRGPTLGSRRTAKYLAWREKDTLEEKIHDCISKSQPQYVRKQDLGNITTDTQIRNLFSVGLRSSETTVKSWLAGDAHPLLADPWQAQGEPDYFDHETLDKNNQPRKRERGNVIMLMSSRESEDDGTENGSQVQRRSGRNGNRGANRLPEITNMNVVAAESDVWSLNTEQRRTLHKYWLQELEMKNRKELQLLTEEYEKICRTVRQIDDEFRLSVLRKANVVGITTTIAAKYREMLKALNCEILIVEEAAEVLEAHILAGLNSSFKHLVLIGDHLQLRPSTAVYELGTKHKLDVSMFERLVQGGVEHVTLQEQRRMRPSFSKLVKSLYPKLKDHGSVPEYENIAGVTANLLFFHHTAEENSTTIDSSKVNSTEAKLVVELTLYLMRQECYSAENIAILTMYSGQLMEIRKLLKERAASRLSAYHLERLRKMQRERPGGPTENEEEDDDDDLSKLLPRVRSVDDFQGEESDIIILSLVRSNDIQKGEGEGTIGFLKSSNRLCVALTRAKKGMYIFGNATLLAKRSSLWKKVIGTLRKDNALDTKIELVCQNHPEMKAVITKEVDFKQVANEGCSRPCGVQLECGHVCTTRCHPGSHESVLCSKTCLRRCSFCRHACTQVCHGRSDCPSCKVRVMKTFPACGHSQEMECSTDPAHETCRSPCPKLLKCLHGCENCCGVPCSAKCLQEVARDLACGHTTKLPCHRGARRYSCKEPCRAILSGCGHRCQGNCERCTNGRKHIPCLQKCGRSLPCGHACEAGCSAPCPPCKKQCQKRCFHSRCKLSCSEICVLPCREPCPWQCEHHECQLLCHEICTRPRCDLPCKKVLKCGHPCIGLCGEPCPSKCRLCHPETIAILSETILGESKESDLYLEMQDCGHLFEVTNLDSCMDCNDTVSGNAVIVKLKGCPQCKTPVWRSMRYGNVVKARQSQLEGVKRKILGYEKTRQGQLKLEQGNHDGAYVDFVAALQQNPVLMDAYFGAGTASCYSTMRHARATIYLSFVVRKSSYAAEVRSTLKNTDIVDAKFGLSKVHCFPPNEELAVKAILQLASVFTKTNEFTNADKLCNAILKRQSDNSDALEIKKSAKARRPAMVVQEMSKEVVGERGQWRQCSSGHYYTVGEYSDFMQQPECLDCQAVKAESNILATINRHTDDDGFTLPPWLGGCRLS